MNNFRKLLLKIACFVFALSSVALVSSVTNVANANETASFVVNETSSARKATDGYYGLQFTATVNNTWFNENVGKGNNATLGILIYPKANATDVTAKTVDAVIEETKAVHFSYVRNSVANKFTFSGAVVYNRENLILAGIPEEKIDDALNMYYAMEMEAMAYIQAGGEIFWAGNTYSTSMRKTAALSVIADPTNKESYEKYYDVVGELSPVVAKGDGSGVFHGLDVEDGSYELYTVDKKSIPVEVVDGALTITDSALLAEMESGDYEAFLFADGNHQYLKDNKFYKVNFTLADVVITTPQELQDAFDPTGNNSKYYALANDIDLEGFNYVGPTGTMNGVFDGRGYAIKNFLWRRAGYISGWTNSNTLFGALEKGGVLKNLAVLDAWDLDHWSPSFITVRTVGSTVENVYVRVRPGTNAFNAFGLYSNSSTVWKNVIFDYQPIDVEYSTLEGGTRAGKTSIQANSQQGLCGSLFGTVSGVYAVTPYHTGVYSTQYYTPADPSTLKYEFYFAENDNEMPYLDTIKNQDGSFTHTRMDYPSNMKEVLDAYNATAEEGKKHVYAVDGEGNPVWTVDDFIKYSEVDNNSNTTAKRSNGFKRYNTFADLASANEDLTTFEESKYWAVVNGTPIWHSELENNVTLNVNGSEVTGAIQVGRDQTATVDITFGSAKATVNYITVDNTNFAVASTSNVISGVANGETTATVNFTIGGLTYNKVYALETVNPIYVIDDVIVYDADTKSFDYDFGGEIVGGHLVTESGNVEADMSEGFGVVFAPSTNVSNVVEMFVSLDDTNYLLKNVQYWDYVIDSAPEYTQVMGYDAEDGVVKFYVTLGNDIDMFITSDVSQNLNSAENNIIMLNGGGVVKKGAYYTLNNYGKDNSDEHTEWWGEPNACGFAGVFDGRGYSVSNIITALNTVKGSSTVANNYGIFSQFRVTDTVIPEVRNVAFIDVVTNTSAILAQYISRPNGTTANMIVDNVYVKQLASCAFGTTFNASNLVTVGTVNQYGPNPLFLHPWNVKISNFVFEHTSSHSNNNNANGIHGSLFGEVTTSSVASEKYDAAGLDSRLENVVYLTNGMLHSGATYANNTADQVATIIKNSGTLAYTRTYGQGFFVYGANETVGQQAHFQGFADGADVSTLTGANLIWAGDDLSNVAPGSYDGTKVYKMKNLVRFKDRATMATAGHDNSYFASSKYWTVVDGAPVWAGARKSATTATINGSLISAEDAFELSVDEVATVAVSASEGYEVVINSIDVDNENVATSEGANITALTAGETTYVVNATVDGVAVSIAGSLKVNRNEVSIDSEVKYFSYNDVFAFAIEGNVQSAVADGVSLDVANGIVLTEKPESLVITTDKEVITLNNIVFDESLPTEIDTAILYDKFELSLDYDFGSDIFSAYMVEGGERVDIMSNGQLDIPAVPTTAQSNVVEITVVTLDGVYVLSNVEYWDEVITSVKDFGNQLDYTSSDEAVIGWFALGNDIDFKLATSGAYTITDLEHEFDLHFATASYNAIYYLIDRYNSNTKTDAFAPSANNGFGGIFDGKGYTLYNHVNIYAGSNGYFYGAEGGLFGKLYSTETITPVVKNFAMINGIATSGGVVIADTVSNVGVQRIENIYIEDARTAYVAYTYDKATNVSTGNIPLSGYSISGIVRDVGHTYMKNVVYKHNEGGAYNYNAYAGEKPHMGSLFSTFNKVDTTQTIDSYDNTYLDNVVVIASAFLNISDVDYNINKTFTARSSTSYVAYGGNPYPTALSSEGTAYLTPQSKNQDGTFVTAYDDYDSLTPGDGSAMENGLYRFKNAYHYVNRNRFKYAYKDNFGLEIIDKLAECPYFAFNRRLYELEIFWQGNEDSQSHDNLPTQVKLGDISLDLRTENEAYNGQSYDITAKARKQEGINSLIDYDCTVNAVSSSNTNVATVSGTTVTTVGVGQTTITVDFSYILNKNTTAYKVNFVVNVTNEPIVEDNPVYYYSATNYFAYDFADEIVSAKYVNGEVETEIDLTYGLILPVQAFSADKVVLATSDQLYIFNNLVLATGYEEVTSKIDYDANSLGLIYDFGDRQVVSAIATYRDASTATLNVNSGIAVPQIAQGEDKNGNVIELLVLLEDGMVNLTNVHYWDRLIDSSSEYSEIFSYNTQSPRLVGWYALNNNIDFYLGSDINVVPEGEFVEYVDWSNHSATAIDGWYQTVQQEYWGANRDLPGWSNSDTNMGFGGVLDGQGFAMDNYSTIMVSRFDGKSSQSFGGLFGQTTSLPGVYTGVRNLALNNYVGNVIFSYYEVGSGTFDVENVFIDWTGTYYANQDRGENNELKGIYVGAYGFSGLVQEVENLALKNVVIQTPYWTKAEGSSNSPTPGVLFKTPMDLAKVEANSENVIVISKHALYYGFQSSHKGDIDNACYSSSVDEETQEETLTFNPEAWKRTNKVGLVVYGANETVGKVNAYQGYMEGTTAEMIKAQTAVGAYQIWGADDVASLVAGDTSTMDSGMFKTAKVVRYDSYEDFSADILAEGDNYAKSFLATFTASCWNVDMATGSISWNRLA